MITYPVYKLVHYLGIFLVLVVSGGALARGLGVPRGEEQVSGHSETPLPDPWKRKLGWGHGLGLFLVLLGGFGMLARLNITEGMALPGWIWAKLGIWTLIGMAVALRRRPGAASLGLIALPVLAVLAGWVALYKPF